METQFQISKGSSSNTKSNGNSSLPILNQMETDTILDTPIVEAGAVPPFGHYPQFTWNLTFGVQLKGTWSKPGLSKRTSSSMLVGGKATNRTKIPTIRFAARDSRRDRRLATRCGSKGALQVEVDAVPSRQPVRGLSDPR